MKYPPIKLKILHIYISYKISQNIQNIEVQDPDPGQLPKGSQDLGFQDQTYYAH